MPEPSLPAIIEALEGRREGPQYRCRCPVHGGRSLMVREGRQRLLVSCLAGCDTQDVIGELRGMGLWPEARRVSPIVGAPSADEIQAAGMTVVRAVWVTGDNRRFSGPAKKLPAGLADAVAILRRSPQPADRILANDGARMLAEAIHARAA